MHPAATHTLTLCGNSLRAACSSSAICSSSSAVMACPFRQPFAYILRLHLARDFVVIDNSRRQSTRSEASGCEHRDLAVRSRFSGVHAQFVLKRRKQLRGAFDVTGGSHAYDACVLAGGLQCEKMIEGRNTVGTAQRDPQRDGDIAKGFLIQISKRLLHRMQSLDQASRMVTKSAHGSVHEPPSFVQTWRCRLGEICDHEPFPVGLTGIHDVLRAPVGSF